MRRSAGGPATPIWCTRFLAAEPNLQEEACRCPEAARATRSHPEAVLGGDGGQSWQRLVSVLPGTGLSLHGQFSRAPPGLPSLSTGDTLSGGQLGALVKGQVNGAQVAAVGSPRATS